MKLSFLLVLLNVDPFFLIPFLAPTDSFRGLYRSSKDGLKLIQHSYFAAGFPQIVQFRKLWDSRGFFDERQYAGVLVDAMTGG
jgi:hypothetical protein